MSRIVVDAIGDVCPLPVVKTKNVIKEMKSSATIEILVDNEIAVQNLTKMAKITGYPVSSKKLEENKYLVTMEVTVAGEAQEPAQAPAEAEAVTCTQDARKGNKVIVISANQMGSGSEELGKTLLKGFIYAVTQQDELPKTMLFYNGGARLTTAGSDSLEDLKKLEEQGVEILTCGTCLNYYGLTEKLAVGGVTNMYTIVEKLAGASKVIKP